MAEDLGERTEEATPKRRQEAREEGNVAKSTDLSGAVLLTAATLGVAFLSMQMLGQGKVLLEQSLTFDGYGDPFVADDAWMMMMRLGAAALRLAAPILVLLWLVAFLSQFAQIGLLLAPKNLQPKMSKLNPMSGFKRIFGPTALVKVIIDTLKVSAVMSVAAVTIGQYRDAILVLPNLALMAALKAASAMLLDLSLRIIALLLILGVIDFAYQKWKQTRELRMTKQQVKDEMKQTEGDPETKRRRLRMQQQVSMQRIGASVPKADVIVTNPEHISIAIQYDDARMNAPKVIAKGADHLALRIRLIAKHHGIPIVERKPLARALYRQVAVGQEVPPEFYKAVAEILAYVYRLSGKAA